MYRKLLNPERGLAVFRMGNPSSPEWAEHFADLDAVATWSTKLGQKAAVVVVPSPGFQLPDAKQRSMLAEKTSQVGYDPYVAVLHPNGVARGILTMLQWMRGGGGASQKPFGSQREALAWLEERRGEPLPELLLMLAETFGEGDREPTFS